MEVVHASCTLPLTTSNPFRLGPCGTYSNVSNPTIRRLGRGFLGDILDQILVEELLVSHDVIFEYLLKGWLLARLPSANQGIDSLATEVSSPEGLRRKHVKSVKKFAVDVF
jgi:hypothetical protein